MPLSAAVIPHCFRAGFLNVGTVDSLCCRGLFCALIVFVVGGCSVPCRMFNSSPGLCVSDDNGTPPHQWEQSRMSWDTAKCPLGGEIPLLENHCFRAFRHCSKRKRINRCYIWKGRNKLILICKLYFCPSRLKSKWINRRT